MPVCIQCGSAVDSLFTVYSPGNIQLTQCTVCKAFADKYVEHDFVVIVIDIFLLKTQVYRHLLINRLRESSLDSTVAKIGILLILFDVYDKWFQIEKSMRSGGNYETYSQLMSRPLHEQYLFVLLQSALEMVVFYCTALAGLWLIMPSELVRVGRANALMSLIISNVWKLLLVLMVIWEFFLDYAWAITVFVLASNVQALSVTLRTRVYRPTVVVLVSFMAQTCINRVYTNYLLMQMQ